MNALVGTSILVYTCVSLPKRLRERPNWGLCPSARWGWALLSLFLDPKMEPMKDHQKKRVMDGGFLPRTGRNTKLLLQARKDGIVPFPAFLSFSQGTKWSRCYSSNHLHVLVELKEQLDLQLRWERKDQKLIWGTVQTPVSFGGLCL